MINVIEYLDKVHDCLSKAVVTDGNKKIMSLEDGIGQWCHLTRKLYIDKNTMYFVGNGASAMMASHMAADATKNGGLKSLAFNDPALMTAVSNDISYTECFSMPLERFGNPGDLLVTISSSGNSPNIIKALETASKIGINSVTISGFKENNESRKRGDLNIFINADTYGVVEVAHQAILHCWLDKYMDEFIK